MHCSVVMPCYQNERTLLASLRSFTEGQRQPPAEVVVVDDGSSVPAAPQLAGWRSPVPITWLRRERVGQSAATNAGIAAAKGEVILLSCADIVASPQLVQAHLQLHARAEAQGVALGVGGRIAYAPWLKKTPFLRYLATDGPQFDFSGLSDGGPLPAARLYAPNFSVHAASLRQVGGFDAAFPYGYQDTDLGLRLQQAGVQVRYAPRALALHDHPTTLAAFVRRSRQVGARLPRMLQRYPDAAARARCRQAVRELTPLLPQLPAWLAAAEAAESALGAQAASVPRAGQAAAQAALFALYTRILGLARVAGVLSAGERAGAALGYDAAAWRAAAAEAAPGLAAAEAAC